MQSGESGPFSCRHRGRPPQNLGVAARLWLQTEVHAL
jgi:hypothetical protein